MEEIGLAHGLLKFLHILLFVYWLGGDAGVFYSSRFVTDPTLNKDKRMMAFKIFVNLDMLPRYCMALMLTVGGLLAEYVGYKHETWMIVGLVILAPAWVWTVHTIHAKEGTAFAQKLARIDYNFRIFMILAIIASVIYHWTTGPLQPFPWLAAKLLIFAFLIFCGFMIRRNIPPFVEGFRTLAATGATPESDQKMIDGMGACRPYVLAIWAGVAIEALIGVFKPGQVFLH
jgi:hypothetical protein